MFDKYNKNLVPTRSRSDHDTSNVFQILQDLRLKQHSGNFEPKSYRPSTTFTTGTIQLKSDEKASKKALDMVNIDNMSTSMSQNLIPCRTM